MMVAPKVAAAQLRGTFKMVDDGEGRGNSLKNSGTRCDAASGEEPLRLALC
jgi:hypothetical protein